MKRITALLMSLIIVLGLSASVCADNLPDGAKVEKYISISFDDALTPEGGEITGTIYAKNLADLSNVEVRLIPRYEGFETIVIPFVPQKTSTSMVPWVPEGNTIIYVESTTYWSQVQITFPPNTTDHPIPYDIAYYYEGKLSRTVVDSICLPADDSVRIAPKEWINAELKVAVNGKSVSFPDQKPLLDKLTGRTYVPVRFLVENLGAEVGWDEERQMVSIVNKFIEGEDTNAIHYLMINQNKFVTAMYTDDGTVGNVYSYRLPRDIYPVIVNGRTMLPFRYVAEFLGAQVYYDDKTGTAQCIK